MLQALQLQSFLLFLVKPLELGLAPMLTVLPVT